MAQKRSGFLRLPHGHGRDVVEDKLLRPLLERERGVGCIELVAELHEHVEQFFRRDGVEGTGGELAFHGLQLFGEQLHAPLRAHAKLLPHGFELYLPHVAELVLQILAPRHERALRDVEARRNGRKTYALRSELHELGFDRRVYHKMAMLTSLSLLLHVHASLRREHGGVMAGLLAQCDALAVARDDRARWLIRWTLRHSGQVLHHVGQGVFSFRSHRLFVQTDVSMIRRVSTSRQGSERRADAPKTAQPRRSIPS